MTTSEFIRTGCGPNPFVAVPGFHVSMLSNCWLHVVDLSLIPDAAASALIELTSAGCGIFFGRDQNERLRSAYVQFSQLCREHRISYLAQFSRRP